MRATPEQTTAWLRSRMSELGIGSLGALAEACESDKGNLSRIFRQQQRPRVDALEPMAAGLQVTIMELLIRIGAVDDQGRWLGGVTSQLAWPTRGREPR